MWRRGASPVVLRLGAVSRSRLPLVPARAAPHTLCRPTPNAHVMEPAPISPSVVSAPAPVASSVVSSVDSSSVSTSSTSSSSYNALLSELLTINTDRKIRLGIQTTRDLLDALGPSFDLTASGVPTIHVAGSNGKGSVATKIARALRLHGLRVGLYTSPHISSYRERMAVNDDLITEEEIGSLLPHILSVTREKDLPATFFELGTALAFGFFLRRKVDVAVIEVGLGGRLDSTNVILPEVSVVTSIALEHTAWLGTTIEAITREKAGIAKPTIPVVIGPNVDAAIVREVATSVGAAEVQQVPSQAFEDYDAENSAVARAALRVLSYRPKIMKLLPNGLQTALITEAMRTRPPCRFQRVRYTAPGPGRYVDEQSSEASEPLLDHATREVVLDVCHNPAAFSRLFQKLAAQFPSSPSSSSAAGRRRNVVGVVGFSSDKDYASCMDQLMTHCSHIYVVSADTPRAATVKQVLDAVEESGQ